MPKPKQSIKSEDAIDAETGEMVKVVQVERGRPMIRSPWMRTRVRSKAGGPLVVRRELATETDINRIIERYDKQGELPPGKGEGQYADVTQLQSMDLTERLEFSREVLDKAGEALSEKQAAEKKAKAEEVEKMRKELAELKKQAENNQTPPIPNPQTDTP